MRPHRDGANGKAHCTKSGNSKSNAVILYLVIYSLLRRFYQTLCTLPRPFYMYVYVSAVLVDSYHVFARSDGASQFGRLMFQPWRRSYTMHEVI